MSRPIRTLCRTAVPAILWALSLGVPAGNAADPAPVGAVSYFRSVCPDGWEAYKPAAGRAIVPTSPSGLSRSVGTPLAEGEQVSHGHKTYVTVRLDGTRSASLGVSPGLLPVTRQPAQPLGVRGVTDESEAGLPLAKLTPCIKAEPPAGIAPSGMVLLFADVTCSSGWSAMPEINGRVLTGAAPSDDIGPFGSLQPLTDGEDRLHSHIISGPANFAEYNLAISATCSRCSRSWVRARAYRYRGFAEEQSSGLPYLQLQACSKDAELGPQINRITHGADFRERALAVGQHATLFGNEMGPMEGLGAELLENGEVSRLRGGVQVMVDETAAPLFFVRDDQINFQIPYEVAGRSVVSIHVVRDGVAGPAREVSLEPAAPALFTWGDDPGRAIAVYADGSLNSAENPAEPGQALIFFATGGGPSSPPGRTGVPAAPPYPAPLGDVELWIGGEQAVLDYAGAAPGFVGLMQVNGRMTSASGPAKVVLKVGGMETEVETIIHGR